jgi:hypothetical protein
VELKEVVLKVTRPSKGNVFYKEFVQEERVDHYIQLIKDSFAKEQPDYIVTPSTPEEYEVFWKQRIVEENAEIDKRIKAKAREIYHS